MSRLVAEDVVFSHGGAPVVDGVSLAVRAGEVLAVVGPSGAGKTTLLWLLAGLLRPGRGRVFVEGAGAEPPRIAVALQPAGLWDHLPAHRHLDLLLRGAGCTRQERRRRVDATLDRVSLLPLRDARPPALSSGERQRLSIARALVLQWPWLLLDEPLTHLDYAHRRAILDLLREQADRHSVGVFMVTHHGGEMLPVADRVAVLRRGQVQQTGGVAEVYGRPGSLETALLLGEAAELDRAATDADGRPLIDGLADHPPGAPLIVRPDLLAFQPSPHAGGPWSVVRAYPGGVEVVAGEARLRARCDVAVAVGAVGRLRVLDAAIPPPPRTPDRVG